MSDDQLGGKAIFSGIAGGMYVLFGLLQVAAGFGLGDGWSDALLLVGGAIDGVIMVIIGLVFVEGNRELRSGLYEGVAFFYVGVLLALFFLFVQLTQISVSYLGAWTVGGEWEDYSAIDTVAPFLYLSVLPIVGLLVWRKGFTLAPRGVPGGNHISAKGIKEG